MFLSLCPFLEHHHSLLGFSNLICRNLGNSRNNDCTYPKRMAIGMLMFESSIQSCTEDHPAV
ncbi:hypothetical protein AB205_0121610 [Aquarana catesbeiana]|uniref:Uncharacterized protein n=1 Tax=Aquarana catesbeiana TaxID=8400 RepID=A0A2G9S5H7_AQUCT|nr:hypothetical protein AB205_0121610 [Aquarana catesbeiana]